MSPWSEGSIAESVRTVFIMSLQDLLLGFRLIQNLKHSSVTTLGGAPRASISHSRGLFDS